MQTMLPLRKAGCPYEQIEKYEDLKMGHQPFHDSYKT